jgi:hypothetical protein
VCQPASRACPDDAEAIARVHVDSWRTTYQGILPDEVLAGLSVERRRAFWAKAPCRFYGALGGVRVREKPEQFGTVTLMEAAYGWQDLTALQ